jgi:hypothetical protein
MASPAGISPDGERRNSWSARATPAGRARRNESHQGSTIEALTRPASPRTTSVRPAADAVSCCGSRYALYLRAPQPSQRARTRVKSFGQQVGGGIS